MTPLPASLGATLEETEALHGAALARAAFALERAGDVTPVVETDDAFLVARLESRQPALDRSWEQVREQIAARIQRERLQKRGAAGGGRGPRGRAGARPDRGPVAPGPV